MDADRIIATLGLEPHPEGGYFRETFRDGAEAESALTVPDCGFALVALEELREDTPRER